MIKEVFNKLKTSSKGNTLKRVSNSITKNANKINKNSKSLNETRRMLNSASRKPTLTDKLHKDGVKSLQSNVKDLTPNQTYKVLKKVTTTDRLAKFGKYKVANRIVTKLAATKLAETAASVERERLRNDSITKMLTAHDKRVKTLSEPKFSSEKQSNNIKDSDKGPLDLGNGRR